MVIKYTVKQTVLILFSMNAPNTRLIANLLNFSKLNLFFSNKKGEILLSPFLPQIYHKLNLLKLWYSNVR
ncbi:hypothetical protein DOS84_00765 [Flavobacterium aquariorum]|uniref:Uncharacterized protein n=1 Tax=Flavobacterium aquariorum TaxID=2217670 RepID=A0A2W7U0T9_9FLAO|nr:hypothetical protein DOS84_00765 [Flavobacterium aquariorum]